MRTTIYEGGVNLWLSAWDTEAWAASPGASWPCSHLAGRRLFCSFDRNGLCDFTIDGKYDNGEVDAQELNACVADHLMRKLPESHPLYFVTVGQFRSVNLK